MLKKRQYSTRKTRLFVGWFFPVTANVRVGALLGLTAVMWALSATSYAESVMTLTVPDLVSEFLHSDDHTGLADKVVESALQRIGYQLNVVVLPAERSLKMADDGWVDGELIRTPGIEKNFPTLLRVPETIFETEFVVFSREPIDLSEGWNALKGKSVGLVVGMKLLEESLPAAALVTRVKSEEQAFSMLENKRVDYVVLPRWMGQLTLRKNQHRNIIISDEPLGKVPIFIYLHSKHAAIVSELANALRAMKQDGSYQKLVAQHLHSQGFPFSNQAVTEGVDVDE